MLDDAAVISSTSASSTRPTISAKLPPLFLKVMDSSLSVTEHGEMSPFASGGAPTGASPFDLGMVMITGGKSEWEFACDAGSGKAAGVADGLGSEWIAVSV
jgi:hypothetical protein